MYLLLTSKPHALVCTYGEGNFFHKNVLMFDEHLKNQFEDGFVRLKPPSIVQEYLETDNTF